MEKETYKAAKDLLDKYDPNSEIVKVFSVHLFVLFSNICQYGSQLFW